MIHYFVRIVCGTNFMLPRSGLNEISAIWIGRFFDQQYLLF